MFGLSKAQGSPVTSRMASSAGLRHGPRSGTSSCESHGASSRIYCACLLLLLVLTPRVDSSWWYIGALGARVICDNIPGLVNKQRQLCQRHPDIMQSIGEGAKEWIRECQHQFRHHRWNCSTLDRDHTVFGRVMVRSKFLGDGRSRLQQVVSRSDGCEVMCCGRGYDTTRVKRITKCECKFKWCCAVECKDCEEAVDIHTCKAPKRADWQTRPEGQSAGHGILGKCVKTCRFSPVPRCMASILSL
ncbi:protein Wnt-2b-like [Osmerus eperlanus]|uniref:protein Wnt-2b-like n=1 Tax=Osmerus eperlanus TaxID=29151 RepID=UPI002E11BC04